MGDSLFIFHKIVILNLAHNQFQGNKAHKKA